MRATLMSELYELQTIVRVDNSEPKTIVKFLVLHNIIGQVYTVVCCNFFYENTTNEEYLQFEKQTVEILFGFPPNERKEWFNSINEAIEHHILTFN